MRDRSRWVERQFGNLTESVSLFSCLPLAEIKESGRNPLKAAALATAIASALAGTALALNPSAEGRALCILAKGLLGGFMHDDGFIDWVDALLVAGKVAKVKTLKRYGVGACGSSLAFSLTLLKFAMLNAFTAKGAIEASAAAEAVGHLTASWHWATTSHAYDHSVVWTQTRRDILVWTAVLSAVLAVIYGRKRVTLVLAQQLTLLVSFNWLNSLAFGGRTGDSAGAIKTLAEATCLMNLKSCIY